MNVPLLLLIPVHSVLISVYSFLAPGSCVGSELGKIVTGNSHWKMETTDRLRGPGKTAVGIRTPS